MANLAERVFKLLALIPPGKVATYGQIASIIQTSPRVVGNILHKNTDRKRYPCHRVIKSDGKLADGYAYGGRKEQWRLLESEGIPINNGKINLVEYQISL